jgi:fused signal recognition particle receptor
MVFNWFRRQFGTGDSEAAPEEQAIATPDTSSDPPQVESDQKAQEQQQVEPTQDQSTNQQSSAVAEDYLSFAKAAYKNIQKQQQLSGEQTSTATDSPESAVVDEPAPEVIEAAAVPTTVQVTQSDRVPQAVEDFVAQTDTELPDTAAITTVESQEPAAPETPGTEETASLVTDSSEPLVEASPTEIAQTITATEDTASVESASAPSEVDATLEPEEPETDRVADQSLDTTPPEPEVLPEESPVTSEVTTDVASAQSQEEDAAPVLEAPAVAESEAVPLAAVEAEEAPAAPLPIWARQSSAERQARLERLKETAIELPEPEPIKTSVQPVESAVPATVEVEEVPGLAFDEGFLWSTQVLAAQGRRPEDVSVEEISWLKRLRQGLDKTRRSLINQLKAIVGQGPLNQDAVMEIEALLLQADVGVEATDYIISTLQKKLREEVLPPEQAIAYLKQILRDLLDRPYQESYSPTFVPEKDTLNIWLMTGVNGVGKTTTIGKLAHLATKSSYRCLIGAADTFRAAAVEQVKIWGERSGTDVIANPGKNTDPAAVVFDAIAAAQARNIELLLVDTAGRLQNKKNLMEELAKIRRIVDKKAPDAKVESLLVLDATLGQNGLRQAEVFSQAAKLSGVVLTKLDGTAKGGVALAVVQQLGLPIRFIGAGEGIEDLRPFSSYEFVEALLSG